MKLALGTVQFGLNYGIAGRGEVVPEPEIREILVCANAVGIDTLDTAAAYGTIEARLERLCIGLNLRIISKLPELPKGLSDTQAMTWVEDKFNQTQSNLSDRFAGYLFHCADDLLGPQANALWNALRPLCRAGNVMLGVSCYSPEELDAVRSRFPVDVAQLPANALDQRFRHFQQSGSHIHVHLRSTFLQGLLLMPLDQALRRLPAAEMALHRWHNWCAERSWSPLFAALSIAKGFELASHCVLGIDNVKQLEAIALQWDLAKPVVASELECLSPDVIDPRFWKLAS